MNIWQEPDSNIGPPPPPKKTVAAHGDGGHSWVGGEPAGRRGWEVASQNSSLSNICENERIWHPSSRQHFGLSAAKQRFIMSVVRLGDSRKQGWGDSHILLFHNFESLSTDKGKAVSSPVFNSFRNDWRVPRWRYSGKKRQHISLSNKLFGC